MGLKNAIVVTLVCTATAAWATSAIGQGDVAQAKAVVQVEFIQPQKFIDVGDRYVSTDNVRTGYLDELRKHIQRRAIHFLSPGQKLEVAITEIDMAGGFESWRPRLGFARIVRDVYPPRIDLQFKVVNAEGTAAKQGERNLRDLSFLMTSAGLYRNDPLRYEKIMLDDWLERELRRPQA